MKYMKVFVRALTGSALLCGLAACGGGSNNVALKGAAISADGATILTSEEVTATRNAGDGAITVTTAAGTFVSNGGPDANGVYTAANGSAEPIQDNLISGTYSFVTPLVVTQNIGGTQHVSSVVIGEASSDAVMTAATGTFPYSGEAAIITDNVSSGTVRHSSANTTVVADFSARTVNVTMSGITSPAAGVPATVDDVRITGATITGSGFSGGTMTAQLGSVDALTPIVGTQTDNSAQGQFFGAAAGNTRPAEVAGVGLVEGTTGSVSAIFVAQ